MHSFAVIAGFAAAANAAAYGYTAQNTTSVAPPTYPASSSAPAYAEYAVSSAPAYAVSSVEYPSYTTTTIKGLSTVCAEPTTLKVGSKTYTVTKSTTIIDNDCEYTTTVPVKGTPTPAKGTSVVGTPVAGTPVSGKASSTPVVGKVSSIPGYSAPAVSSKPVVPLYPSSNGTVTYAVPTGATPSSTKPAASQFTGAAAQTGAAMLAIVGAVAAFL